MAVHNITEKEVSEMTHEGLVLYDCGGNAEDWLCVINKILTSNKVLLYGGIFKEVYSFRSENKDCLLFLFTEGVFVDQTRLNLWMLQTRSTLNAEKLTNIRSGLIRKYEKWR